MAKEDGKDPKGGSLEPSKEQVMEFLQEVLSDPKGAAELEFPLRIPKKVKKATEEDQQLQAEPAPETAEKHEAKVYPAQKPTAAPSAPSPRRRAERRHAAFTLAKAAYALLINAVLFFATFSILYLIMYIPGFTKFNRLYFNSEISIDLMLLPLWFNVGCAIGSAAVLFGLTINNQRCRLGLVIGTPAGVMALVSNFMEGYVGNGILFGFGAGIICVVLILICFVRNMGLGDVLRISCVAFFSILAIIGPILHFFAALVIGLPIALATQVILSICVLISR